MSLKAKIEAVIYASEEPVTLAQLVSLLGQEAQAELDRAAEAQQTLALDEAGGDEAFEVGELIPDEAAVDGEPESGDAPEPEVAKPIPSDETGMEGAPAFVAADFTYGDEAALNGARGDLDEPLGSAESGTEVEPHLDVDEAAMKAALARAEKARAAKLRGYFREMLDRLIGDYAAPEQDRGLEIREVAGGFRIATKPEYHDAVRGFVKSLKPPLKLTLQALETLAVVAYKQPVTSPEISEIRGVDSSGVLGSLIARKLITTAGRKQVIGRPILYKTTKEFLLKFGLKDVAELPSIEEFEKMAGQMAEQEDIPMGETGLHQAPENAAQLEEERETHEGQADGESAPADDVQADDKAGVDGRISSLPPKYDDETDDPSAQEAEIQERENG